MAPSTMHRALGAVSIAVTAMLMLCACLGTPTDTRTGAGDSAPRDTGSVASDSPPAGEATPATEPDPGETAYLAFLRSIDPPFALFMTLPDDELLALGRDLCALAERGASADELLEAWLDTGTNPTDEAIVSLFTAADFTFCPGAIDLDDWYSSPVWRERTFVQTLGPTAAWFGFTDDASVVEMGHAICDLLATGTSVDAIVTELHKGRDTGMAPDPDDALALIAGSRWAFCPPEE